MVFARTMTHISAKIFFTDWVKYNFVVQSVTRPNLKWLGEQSFRRSQKLLSYYLTIKLSTTFALGSARSAPSEIPQGGNAARVGGCSDRCVCLFLCPVVRV